MAVNLPELPELRKEKVEKKEKGFKLTKRTRSKFMKTSIPPLSFTKTAVFADP